MRYFDTGGRDPSQSLAKWFTEELKNDIAELRLQTGFFTLDGGHVLKPTLRTLADKRRVSSILIGSNDSSTLRDDVAELMIIMGIPRPEANLGVVSFSGAFFHPKTYHIHRCDGTQAAFVGSANLTAQGLALHVEAGIALDTREGDDPALLSDISQAIDAWFVDRRPGMTRVTGLDSLSDLTAQGVLALAPPPRSSQAPSSGFVREGVIVQPRLRPLFDIPRVSTRGAETRDEAARAEVPSSARTSNRRSAPRVGFPQYLLFDPSASGPTSGASALTGTQLPGDAAGLIVRLNRDSARHFMGGTGTANISIPVATVSVLRFGMYGKHDRPRAEYELWFRYVSDAGVVDGGRTSTNIMGYGFAAGESGHGDIRMLVPRDVADLGRRIAESGKESPKSGDLALLEWPLIDDPVFRLTLLDQNSDVGRATSREFQAAERLGALVGQGACWLPSTLSPSW